MKRKQGFAWGRALALPCILALVALISCDIGNWDITRSQESSRNVNAFEEIDFLTGMILSGPRAGSLVEGRIAQDLESGGDLMHNGQPVRVGQGAYPLSFGVSTQRDSVGITGGGHISRRFWDGRSLGLGQQDPLPGNFHPDQLAASGRHGWLANWGTGPGFTTGNVGPVNLPAASPHRGNPHFRPAPGHVPEWPEGVYRIPPVVPPGFIEVAAVSNNRGGKIAGSEDGIAFLFREVPIERNFVMEADFLIVQYGNILASGAPQNPGSNGQEGFGIMVRDFVPQISVTNPAHTGTTFANFEINNHRWRLDTDAQGNKVAGIGRDTFDFWPGGPLHGSDSNMIMAGGTKRGMNVKVRDGVAPDPVLPTDELGNMTVPGMQLHTATRFRWWPSPLPDYSFFTESIGGVDVPTFAARPSFPRWGTTVRVRLERTNDGFAYTITNLDDRFDNIDTETGRLIEADVPKPSVTSAVHGKILNREWNVIGNVNPTHFYVGLFAARDAVVWVSNIRYFEADSHLTAPAQPPRPEFFDPTIEILSPPFYTGVNTLFFSSNTYGRISVLQDGERIPDGRITTEWINARENGTGVPMTLFTVPIREPDEGDTIFTVLFTPGNLPPEHADRNFEHSSNAQIRHSFTVTRRSFSSPEYCLATGANMIFAAPVNVPGASSESGAWGSPQGDGTRGRPLDLQTALNHVLPGQHVVMLNGRYVFDTQLLIPWFNDGMQFVTTNGNRRCGRKVLRAETINQVWLDWNKREDLGPVRGNGTLPADAFLVRGSFWHFDGFHVRGAPDKVKGLTVGGSNNRFTRLSIYNNGDTGFQISFSASIPTRFWPSDNLVMWTESFHNLDGAQTDADGFGVKLTVGPRNVIYSSIAHHNNDDGWDLFAKRESGPIGITLVDRSIAYMQGWMLNRHRTAAGGIGFKMGGESIGIVHEIRNSLAFGNMTPIGSNSNPNLIIRNSTAITGENFPDVSAAERVNADQLGPINITGPAPVGGNAFDSVGQLVRAGFNTSGPGSAETHQPQGSNWGIANRPAPPAAAGAITWHNLEDFGVATNWRDFMVSRPASFWGRGDAAGDGRPGTQFAVVNSTVGQYIIAGVRPSLATPMPADYAQWDQFKLFLPRDEWFAYPILHHRDYGYLYRVPGIAQGAHSLYDETMGRNGMNREQTVLHYIPWARVNTPTGSPWNDGWTGR